MKRVAEGPCNNGGDQLLQRNHPISKMLIIVFLKTFRHIQVFNNYFGSLK